MPFVPVLDVAQFAMRYTVIGQLCVNVFHYYNPGGWTAGTLLTQAERIKNSWITHLAIHQSYQVNFRRVDGRDLSVENGIGIEYTVPNPLTIGLDIDGAAPLNVTFAVKWTTGMTGRSFRGRTYHIGATNNNIVDSKLTLITRPLLEAGYTNFLTGTNNGVIRMVVVSRFHNNAPRAVGVATPIIGCSVEETVDSQRRRLPGRGA